MLLQSLPYAAPPYHEVTITTDPPEGPYPLGSTVILQCSVSPPPPGGVTYRWTDSIPSTYLSSTQPNLTLTIPAHHPSQGHYYCTVYNGSLVLGVRNTTIRVRGELDIFIYQQLVIGTFHDCTKTSMHATISNCKGASLWYKPHRRAS